MRHDESAKLRRQGVKRYALIAFLFLVTISKSFSLSGAWHPLAQVSTNSGGQNSVDTNSDGVIDASEVAQSANALSCTGCIDAGEIYDGGISLTDLAPNVVSSAKIVDESITAADLAPDSVAASEIASGAVGTSEIADGAVSSTDILDSTILTGDIGVDTIIAADLAADSVGDSELYNGGAWTLSSTLNVDSNTLVIDPVNNRVVVGTSSSGNFNDLLDVGDGTNGWGWDTDTPTNSAYMKLVYPGGARVVLRGSQVLTTIYGNTYFDSNVGIGTTSPSAQLHTTGTLRFQNFASCTALETDANGNVACGTDDTGATAGLSSVMAVENSVGAYVLNMNDQQVQNARALQLKDWDDDAGGADDTVRVLRRDGNWMFYNGGIAVGQWANDALGAVGNGNIRAGGTVTAADFACTDCLEAANIAAGAVGTSEIADGTITASDILDSTITTSDIAADTIAAADIAAGAVGTSEIADGSVASVDILDGTIASADILDGTIASADILDSTITTSDIAADTIAAADLAADSVGDSELFNGGAWTLSSNLNIDSNTLYVDQANNRVGVNRVPGSYQLEVGGRGAVYGDFTVNDQNEQQAVINMIGNDMEAGTQHTFLGMWEMTWNGQTGNDVFAITMDERPSSGAWSGFYVIHSTNWGSSWTWPFSISNADNVGIGYQTSSYKLGVNGNAGKPGGGSWSDSSDIRLKKNIRPLEDALDRITQLEGVTYEWKNPSEHGGEAGMQASFIAQEVEKVFPEWVSEIDAQGKDKELVSEDGKMKVLNLPYAFDAYMVEAIKEQQDIIEKQGKEIADLKKRLNDLERKI